MTDAPKRRGRPPKAAQSLDEALAAVYNGTAPKRPRNEFERQAGAKRQGRKPDFGSATQQAADYVVYMVRTEGASFFDAASRDAATAFGVNLYNIRRYAKKKLRGPMVSVQYKGRPTWAGYIAPRVVPLVVEICDHPPSAEGE